MMHYSWPSLILIFVLMSIATTGPRGSFILFGQRYSLPPRVRNALRYAPVAALTAIISPDLFALNAHDVGGAMTFTNPKIAAALVAGLSVWFFRKNFYLPFITGMTTLWLLRAMTT